MGLRGKRFRMRFATIELFPKRRLGEENEAGTKLFRITPTTGGAGRKLFGKLLGGAGAGGDSSGERDERAGEEQTQHRSDGPPVKDPLDR